MIGIDEDGRKDVLGFWNKATEGADEWMKIFDEIQSRGVEKVSFISADGLSGLERGCMFRQRNRFSALHRSYGS